MIKAKLAISLAAMWVGWRIGGLAGLALGLAGAMSPAGAEPRAHRSNLIRLNLHEAYAPDRRPTDWEGSDEPQASLPTIALDPDQLGADATEISQRIDWPQVVAFHNGGMGTEARAYATRAAKRRRSGDERAVDHLQSIGVDDGQTLGDEGRWYLFAATSGRAVGLNLLNDGGGMTSGGWTTDATSTLLTDAQLGIGWRKGDTQTSLGYLHRDVKGRRKVMGVNPPSGEMVGLSVSVKASR